MRPLAVAFLSPSWPLEGAQNGIVTYVDRITAALRQMGHQPCVLSPCVQGAGPWPDVYLLGEGGRTLGSRLVDGLAYRLSPQRALRSRYGANLVRAAQRAIAERGVELIEMEETFGLVQLVKPRLPIPVMVRLHGPYFANGAASDPTRVAPLRERVRQEGITISTADGISSPSKELLESTRAHYGLPLPRAVVIPCPAPIVPRDKRWGPGDCNRSRILFVGRFDRHKGGDIVIESFRIVTRRYPDIRLWFVGAQARFVDDNGRSWSLDEYLAERAPDIATRVDRLGYQPPAAIEALRRQAMLTVVASRYETFGMVVIEAMAHGSPLVATRTGGIAEVVEDGVNGVLCRPEDPEEMAAKICTVLADPEMAARLGQRAGEDAAGRYHPDRVAHETAEYHRDLLERRHSRETTRHRSQL